MRPAPDRAAPDPVSRPSLARKRLVLACAAGLAVTTLGCRGVEQAPDEPAPGEPASATRLAAPPAASSGTGAHRAGEPRDLRLEDLSGKDPLEGRPDSHHRFSGDGRALFFLRPSAADGEVLDLWRMALPDGRPTLLASAESLLAQGRVALTEAQRSVKERSRVRHRGITSFALDRAGRAVIVPVGGFVYRVDAATGKATRVFAAAGGELDLRPSPDGSRLSFVRGGDLYVKELATGAERRLTRGGNETLTHGLAEFVAQEELDRHHGHWWSPDGAYLALAQVDESKVELVHRHQISSTGVKVVPQRYPAAGTANARVRLGVVALATGQVRWIPLPSLNEGYLARVTWAAPAPVANARAGVTPAPVAGAGAAARGGPPRLFVQCLSRSQRSLTLDLVDPVSLAVRRVLVEEAPDYVNLHDDLRVLAGRPSILWSSEVSGLRQLYQVELPGPGEAPVVIRPADKTTPDAKEVEARAKKPRALTRLAEPLYRVEAVDEKAGYVYASAIANRGRERTLYRFTLEGSHLPKRLTEAPGWHEITMDRQAAHYVDSWSDLHRSPAVSLHRADGSLVAKLGEASKDPLGPFRKAATRFVTVRAMDGTPLNGLLFTPPGRESTRATDLEPGRPSQAAAKVRGPAVLYVYGGPQGQTVARRWSRTTPWHHFLAERGFAVLLVDGRGSAHRGKAFETKLWRKFGVTDVEDVAAAARWLGTQPGIDPHRLGLWGWSYGGYLTVMTLLQTGDLFRAGVAVAPVADWRLYDTAYTERYLGLPGPQKDLYERSNPVRLAKRLEARLLLLHGMSDDNVLLTHTLKLASALQEAGRPFDMMLYPGKAHSIQGTQTRRHLLGTLLDYFQQHLGGGAPATGASRKKHKGSIEAPEAREAPKAHATPTLPRTNPR